VHIAVGEVMYSTFGSHGTFYLVHYSSQHIRLNVHGSLYFFQPIDSLDLPQVVAEGHDVIFTSSFKF
jgi:hypothetical protein